MIIQARNNLGGVQRQPFYLTPVIWQTPTFVNLAVELEVAALVASTARTFAVPAKSRVVTAPAANRVVAA